MSRGPTGPTGIVRDRLAETVARQLAKRLGPGTSWEDLYDMGLPALAAARKSWDGRGKFEPYALERIRWGVLDELRKQRRGPQIMALAAIELSARQHARSREDVLRSHHPERDAEASIDDVLDSGGANYAIDVDAAEAVEEDAERMRLRRAVEELPPPENEIIDRYCYLGQTFDEIGEQMGMGESTACDHHARAVKRLKRLFGSRGDAPGEPRVL